MHGIWICFFETYLKMCANHCEMFFVLSPASWMCYSMAHQFRRRKKTQILFIRNECVCRHGSINKIRHQTVCYSYIDWISYCYITIHAITNHHNVKITVYVHFILWRINWAVAFAHATQKYHPKFEPDPRSNGTKKKRCELR